MNHRDTDTRTMKIRRSRAWLRSAVSLCAVGLLAAGLTGCGPSASERAAANARSAYFAGDYQRAAAELVPFAKLTDENFALNNARLGSAYLAGYNYNNSEAAFLNSYEVINSVGVNAGGRSLGAVLVDEKIRIWKGEPFERAMVNFYLGLIYTIRNDPNNARAAYENALFKLQQYDDAKDQQKNDQAESNFSLANIMLGRTWQKLGRDDLANACFARAVQLQSYLAPLADPEMHRRANVVLVVDYGYGPRRNTEFDGSILTFQPTPEQVGPIPSPRVLVNGQPYDFRGANVPPVDLLALAQDRRWQSIDTIRATKSAVGTGLLAAGAVMGSQGANSTGSRQRTDLTVAAALFATGLLLKATSQADTREWGMLPRTTFVLPLNLPPGVHTLTIDMGDGTQQVLTGVPAMELPDDRTYYVRMQRFSQGPIQFSAQNPQ